MTIAVNIPVVQAIQAVEKSVNSAKSVGSSKNDRINALGAVNASFEAWRTAEQVGKLAEAMGQNPAQALSQRCECIDNLWRAKKCRNPT
ncbi:hypothetical protein ACFQ02_08440 [Seminibacterium arietis]|uniref:Uncharacterized protein n=1 Tax=Seminibacterium arietis TaxID=1173502 RepID=A0ABW3IBB4_9PAST